VTQPSFSFSVYLWTASLFRRSFSYKVDPMVTPLSFHLPGLPFFLWFRISTRLMMISLLFPYPPPPLGPPREATPHSTVPIVAVPEHSAVWLVYTLPDEIIYCDRRSPTIFLTVYMGGPSRCKYLLDSRVSYHSVSCLP